MTTRPRFLILISVICLSFGLGSGIAIDRLILLDRVAIFGTIVAVEPADARPTSGVFWQAWRLIEDHYVDTKVVTPQNLTRGAIAGMLDALGDNGHTRYLTPEDRKQQQDDLQGRLEGIGIEVEDRDHRITVVAPIDGSPAQQAGLRSGDVIVKVDGRDVTNQSLERVSGQVRGPKGTAVVLGIRRTGIPNPLEFTITRQELVIPEVTWASVPGETIAQIRISTFGNDTDAGLRKAIAQARAAGNTRFILDLRNDSGGLLDQSIRVASEFLSSGNVLLEADRSGDRRPRPVQPGGTALNDPLVVLVNRGTASAAEIVAGALQDHRRAVLVGEQTFGTGTVLQEYPLRDGSALLLGVRQWLTPDGHFIREGGITPDRTVPQTATSRILVPGELRGMTAEEFRQSGDEQLFEAIQVLKQQAAS